MENNERKRRNVVLVVILVVLVLLFGIIYFDVFDLTGRYLIDRDKYVQSGFAPPYNIFEGNVSVFLVSPDSNYTLPGSSQNFRLNVSASIPGGVIYKKGYYWNNFSDEWEEFNFSQNTIGDSNWISNYANKILDINRSYIRANSTNFILAYVCKKYNGSWECGCSNETSCGKWSLQLFNVSVEDSGETAGCAVDDDCHNSSKTCVLGKCVGNVESECAVDEVFLNGLCLSRDQSLTGYQATGPGVPGWSWMSYVAGKNGSLMAVKIFTYTFRGEFRIYEGEGLSGNILYSMQGHNGSCCGPTGWTSFFIDENVPQAAGRKYTIAVQAENAYSLFWRGWHDFANKYPNGKSNYLNMDLGFETFLIPETA